MPTGTVFLSYASEDAAAAERICASLRTAGIEVWFDQSELRGGDAWDAAIREQIKGCALFVPVISQNAHARIEGYFRLEWKLAVDRSHLIAPDQAFLLPVVIDDTPQTDKRIPDRFRELQWSRLPAGEATPAFIERVSRLLLPESAVETAPSRAPTAPSGSTPTRRSEARWRSRSALLAAAVVAATGGAYYALHRPGHATRTAGAGAPTAVADGTGPSSAVPEKSIAVLPFVDMSEKRDQAYFADGIAEEVLDRLAKVPGLRVVGRASSFQFRGKNTDPASIGTALGVAYLLEGSVRREEGRVRVAAQLVEARTGAERWSDHFDSDLKDVLGVQDTLAAKLARALQITVEADTARRPVVKSPAALDAYLRGLQSEDRQSREDSDAAVADFQRALALDPTFADAASGLAATYINIGVEGWLPTRVAYGRAREAAALAQRLDPKSSAPHVEMAQVHMFYDWDWAGAERELQEAFLLGPRETNGMLAASQLAAARGRWDEARQLGIEAIELDPLNATAHLLLGWNVYLHTQHFVEAEQSIRRGLQITPKSGSAQYFLGEALMLEGRNDAALAEFRKETVDDGQFEGSAMTLFAAGRKAESDAQLAQAIRHNGTSWPSEIARVYAFRGEKDRAFEWLNRAYALRDEDLYLIKGDPLLKNLEGDARYKAFLRKMNLPE
jgi:TolB-like protein